MLPRMRAVLLLWMFFLPPFSAELHDSPEILDEVKGQLARLLFEKDAESQGSKDVSLTWEEVTRKSNLSASASGLYRSAEDEGHFLLDGEDFLHLPHSSSHVPKIFGKLRAAERSSLNPLCKLQMTQWKNNMLTAACYTNGICEISKSVGQDFGTVQRLQVKSAPVDVKFFNYNGQLFMAIASDVPSCYRWTGDYFDEIEEAFRPAARVNSMSLFPVEKSFIILINTDASTQVYKFDGIKTKHIQSLYNPALHRSKNILEYDLPSVYGAQHFFAKTVENQPCQTYWWNGRRFSVWSQLRDLGYPEKIFFGTLNSVPFLFVVNKGTIDIHHVEPTRTTLVDPVRRIEVQGEVLSVSANDPNLAIMLRNCATGERQLIVLKMNVVVADLPGKEDDEDLTRCLKRLTENIKKKGKELSDHFSSVDSRIVNPSQPADVDEVQVQGNATFRDIRIKELIVTGSKGMELKYTPTQMQAKLRKMAEKLKGIQNEISPPDKYIVEGDLNVDTMIISDVNVDELNGREMQDFLSVTRDQKITSSLNGKEISAKKLDAELFNRLPTSGLLQRSKPSQTLTGKVNLKNLNVGNVEFKKSAKINGIYFNKFADKTSRVVGGLKTVDNLVVNSLKVKTINNESYKDWLEGIVPSRTSSPSLDSMELDVNILKVKNLTVENINLRSSSDFMKMVHDRSFITSVKSLKAKTLNGIPVDRILTVDDDQSIQSEIAASSASADKVVFDTINDATVEEVAESLRDTFFAEPDDTIKVRFDRPVKITGNFNVSSLEFAENGTAYFRRSSSEQERDKSDFELSRNDSTLLEQSRIRLDKIVIKGDLKVTNKLKTGELNGVLLAEEKLRTIVLLDGNYSLENITFNNLKANSVKCSAINGMELESREIFELVVNGTLTVPSIHLTGGCKAAADCKESVSKLLIHGNVTGLQENLQTHSENLLSKTKNQNVTGDFNFERLNANFLKAERINDISMSDVLYTDSEEVQEISSEVSFEDIGATGNLSLGSMEKCNLQKLAKTNVSFLSQIDTLEIAGNLTWRTSNPEIKSLSYLMDNLITNDGDVLNITAPVLLKKDALVNNLKCLGGINNVDLNAIADDALFSSVAGQKITVASSFKQLTGATVTVKDNISVDNIEGVDIIALNARLVRRSEDKIVRGLKTFSHGFTSHALNLTGVHGVNTSDLVYIEELFDETVHILPATKFRSLKVMSDLQVEKVNGKILDDFLQGLIPLSANQTIHGFFYVGGHAKIGSLHTNNINSLDLSKVILRNKANQSLLGDLIFSEDLEVSGDVEVDRVNDIDLSAKFASVIKTDENTTIHGNVVFEDSVTVSNNVETFEINNCSIRDLYAKEKNFKPFFPVGEHKQATEDEFIKIRKKMAEKKPKILKYLTNYKSLDVPMDNVMSTSSVTYDNGTAITHVYGLTSKGCAKGCFCPLQYTLLLTSNEVQLWSSSNRTFPYHDEALGLFLTVRTDTQSYSDKCSNSTSGTSVMEWMLERNEGKVVSSIPLPEGYLGDVKYFKLGSSVFIVMAFINQPHDESRVLVYELDSESDPEPKLVDSLAVKGAMTLDVLWARPSYILVLGNAMSEDHDHESMYTEIYYFNEKDNKFELMNKWRKHGVAGLKAIRIGADSFVFVVQKYPWPVIAYKYNQEARKYEFFEKFFNQKSGFISVNAIPLGEADLDDTYVGVVYMNDVFSLFSYKHIEGFVEEITVHQKDVHFLQVIRLKNEAFLLALSPSGKSRIYSIHYQ